MENKKIVNCFIFGLLFFSILFGVFGNPNQVKARPEETFVCCSECKCKTYHCGGYANGTCGDCTSDCENAGARCRDYREWVETVSCIPKTAIWWSGDSCPSDKPGKHPVNYCDTTTDDDETACENKCQAEGYSDWSYDTISRECVCSAAAPPSGPSRPPPGPTPTPSTIPIPPQKAVQGAVGFCPLLEGGLVPCGRETDDPNTPYICECYPCQLCHLFVLFKRIVDEIVLPYGALIAILIIVIGGVMFITASGDPGRINTAKNILKSAGIGLVIILVAWLIVDTIITFLTPAGSPFQAWSEIVCPYCGDGTCDPDREDAFNCPVDCLAFLWVPLSESNVGPNGEDEVAQIALTDTTLPDGTVKHPGEIIKKYQVGNNPSRLTVIPGGDVWVGNRDDGQASVTRLTPDFDKLPYYKVVDTYKHGGSGGTRAVTYDLNGNIWIGNAYDSKIMELNPLTGEIIKGPYKIGDSKFGPYGAIGDPFGNVWFVDRGEYQLVRVDLNAGLIYTNIPLPCPSGGRCHPYGIGMDNEGDIWVACSNGCGVLEIAGGRKTNIGTVINNFLSGIDFFRGIAVDGNNNVWVAKSNWVREVPDNNKVYVIDSNGNQVPGSPIDTGSTAKNDVIGVAIERGTNNAWVIAKSRSLIFKYEAVGDPDGDGKYLETLIKKYIGGNPYNYSDMTGFRSMGCPKPR